MDEKLENSVSKSLFTERRSELVHWYTALWYYKVSFFSFFFIMFAALVILNSVVISRIAAGQRVGGRWSADLLLSENSVG